MIRFILGLALVGSMGLLAAESKNKEPFNGKDLDGWVLKEEGKGDWKVGKATLDEKDSAKIVVVEGGSDLINASNQSVNIWTEEKYEDCLIELEVFVPKGSNSGIYVMGEYEVQILDSYGKEKVGPGDLGGLYGASAPKVNASKKPGEWQKFEIDFQAPRFDKEGKKTHNAIFKSVKLNDELIHEDVEMKGPTPSGITGKEAEEGPVMFQGDHGPVAFRNIKITPRSED